MSFLNSELTTEQRELLICLSEEAAEVTQVVSKILRFGLGSDHPLTGESKKDRLHSEVGDFIAIVDRLVELELLNDDKLNGCVAAKQGRLENYLLFKGDTDIVNY